MIKINEILVVEGKYDRAALQNIVDATIIETSGFGIFKDSQLKNMLKTLAKKRGIIILTDSDSAGRAIRNHINGFINNKYIKNAYIPNICGKESRKRNPSKENMLGVEGMTPEIILKALRGAGITTGEVDKAKENSRKITKTDLYEDGFSGGADSEKKRKYLQKSLGLPDNLSANRLLEVLNIISDYDEYKKFTNGYKNEL